MWLHKFSYILLLLTLLFPPNVAAQDSNVNPNEKFTVKFVRSISTSEDVIKDKSLGEKIVDWIFGEDIISLIKPMKVIEDSWNRLLVLDQGGGYIVRIDTVEEEFKLILNQEDKIFPSLVDICEMKKGIYLLTDSKENIVYVYDEKKDIIKPFIKDVKLNQPTGIAFNFLTKEVWVVETLAHKISIFDTDGNLKRVIGARGTGSGQFNFPAYIWIDKNGIVYVIDSMNFRLQILDSSGKLLKIFGESGDATGYFARPKGVAVDNYGHIYIVDALFNSVQIFDSDGQFLFYFGSKGNQHGEFWLPTGIFIDSNNYIYIADSYNSRIQIFRLIENEKN